jgi:DNA-binding NtrC family response regulator
MDIRKLRVVIASSDAEIKNRIAEVFDGWPIHLVHCSSMKHFRDTVAAEDVHLAFCEERLADGGYRDVLEAVKARNVKTKIVVTVSDGDWFESGSSYLRMMDHGAYDVLRLPCETRDVEWTATHALR